MADGASVFDPIEHVVVLMLENHSFDNILGSLASINPQINGFDPAHPAVLYDKEGNMYPQTPVVHPVLKEDVPHDFKWVQMQINDGKMDGFVRAAEEFSKHPTQEIKATPMDYFPVGALPATHGLAQNFTICDNYFASVPSSTWPNRLFALSGTSKGWVDTPTDAWDAITHSVHVWDQPTLFHVLQQHGVSVRVYYGDAPLSTLLVNNIQPHIMKNYFKHGDHFGPHVAKGDLPQFTFIEPHYLGGVPTDNHPPHNFIEAEKLVAEVYNTLRSNEALWKKTLFVLTFDEHGGFYDHVVPPQTVPPDDHTQEGFDFKQLGVRIPVILASPWLDAGAVDHTLYDHTSLIKYLLEKWNVPLDSLGKRVPQANSLKDTVLQRASQGLPARTDTPLKLEVEDNVHPHIKHAINEYVKKERDADVIGNNKLFEMFAALTHNLDKGPSPTHFMYNVAKFLKLPGVDRWTHACTLWDHHVDHNGGNKHHPHH